MTNKIKDLTVRAIFFKKENYRWGEWAVLGIVGLSIAGTMWAIQQYAWMGPSRSAYIVALGWILAAAFITYISTIREIERIQETQQKLDFNAHNALVNVQGANALTELSSLAKQANGSAYLIKYYVYFVGIVSLLFGAAMLRAALSDSPVKILISLEIVIADAIKFFCPDFETKDTKFVLMNLAIWLQIGLVGIVVFYDHLLHEMNHKMRKAYNDEIFTDVPATQFGDENTRDGKWIIEVVGKIRAVKIDLEIATFSLIAIDCPIIVGVAATAILEFWFMRLGLSDSLHMFALGISTGALALHIIAANIMFMISPRLLSALKSNHPHGRMAPEGAAS